MKSLRRMCLPLINATSSAGTPETLVPAAVKRPNPAMTNPRMAPAAKRIRERRGFTRAMPPQPSSRLLVSSIPEPLMLFSAGLRRRCARRRTVVRRLGRFFGHGMDIDRERSYRREAQFVDPAWALAVAAVIDRFVDALFVAAIVPISICQIS